MIIEYSFEGKDILHSMLYSASKSRSIKNQRIATRSIIPFFFMLYSFVCFFEEKHTSAILFTIVAILWFFLYPFRFADRLTKKYQNQIIENYKDKLGKPIIIIFENNYILTKLDGIESKIPEKEIAEIIEISKAIFIRFKSGSQITFPKEKIKEIDILVSKLKEISIIQRVNYTVDNNWAWK
jgi:hypothetical protein